MRVSPTSDCNNAFEGQVGRNLEVYVDDLVIKSHTEDELVRDIVETFRALRKINMKLNPKKCTFGAREGMFLGYLIEPDGIKPCPEKTKLSIQLPSPAAQMKEVQSLKWEVLAFEQVPIQVSRQVTPLVQNTQEVYEEGRLPLDYRSRRSFHAAQAAYSSTSHASRSPTRGGVDNIFIPRRTRMGVRNLEANVDSRLVANHVLGEYVAKEDNMIRYLDKTKSLIQGFDRFTIRQGVGLNLEASNPSRRWIYPRDRRAGSYLDDPLIGILKQRARRSLKEQNDPRRNAAGAEIRTSKWCLLSSVQPKISRHVSFLSPMLDDHHVAHPQPSDTHPRSHNPKCSPINRYAFSNQLTQAKCDEFEEIRRCQRGAVPGLWKDNNTTGKKVPKKVLRCFSIIPRQQRLYKSNHTAKEMTWHAIEKFTENGKMQHLVDGKAWKNFDTRDVRLS
ncbi:reverse transcriptase domain-containing protein [Tanacetum coccineum]